MGEWRRFLGRCPGAYRCRRPSRTGAFAPVLAPPAFAPGRLLEAGPDTVVYRSSKPPMDGRTERVLAPPILFGNRDRHRYRSKHWLQRNARPATGHPLIYATARDLTRKRCLERQIIAIEKRGVWGATRAWHCRNSSACCQDREMKTCNVPVFQRLVCTPLQELRDSTPRRSQ